LEDELRAVIRSAAQRLNGTAVGSNQGADNRQHWRQRVPQFVAEHRQKFILRAVCRFRLFTCRERCRFGVFAQG
jgi:hypothetical protein